MNEHDQIIAIITGKNQSPISLESERTALVVVDMQRCFTQPSFPFTEIFEKLSPGSSAGFLKRTREIVLPSVQRLLRVFRATKSPVVFTAVGTEAGDGRELPPWLRAFDEVGLSTLGKRVWPVVGDPGWEVDEALEPMPGEIVLNKHSAGTFATTNLEQLLRQRQIESVIVTGLSSGVCVATTARESADRGFKTIMVSDACTTLSETMYRASLEAFNIAFGWVRTADEVIALLEKAPRAATAALRD
jgi:nicotinamidase-related amidase